jgi:hypothetical protein
MAEYSSRWASHCQGKNAVTVGCTSKADLNLLLYNHYSPKDNRKYVLKLALTTVVFHGL